MSNDDGSVVVVSIGAIAIVLILGLWLTALAIVLRARLEATTAADAAALAAAPVTFLPFGALGTPSEEAARFAELNGSELRRCDCPVDRSFEPRTVEVRVARTVDLPVLGAATIEATGRAEFVPAMLFE